MRGEYLGGLRAGVPPRRLPAAAADQLDRHRSVAQTPPSSAPLAWQAVPPGGPSGHMFFLSFYLLTVIFTTGSPLKLPPSVLECLLSIPPTPPIDLVYSFDIHTVSVIWLIDLVKKYSAKLPLV